MEFTDEISEQGVTERRFDLEVEGQQVPGILWTPTGARGPRPLLLLGHGGTQHKRTDYVLGNARVMVRHHGWAAAAIDAPGHGDREVPGQMERLRARLMKTAKEGPKPPTAEERSAFEKRFRMAGTEWKATLDALQGLDEIGATSPVAYWGVSMGTRFGVPFIASEPRIRAAVLGLNGIFPEPDAYSEAAKQITIPLVFLFQLNDELVELENGLALFRAFGSQTKTMHINPGGHVAMPRFEREKSEAFLVRHLGEGPPAP